MTKPVMVIGFREMKNAEGRLIVNTTSKSTNWSKGLSPFYLGPVRLYGGYEAKNVENAWQFAKVYAEHADKDGNPTASYFDWAKKGWGDTYAHRYPMGKGSIPLHSYWDGHQLTYIEARKAIYGPLYSKAVVNTPAFEQLLDLYESGEEFALLDFDGYDYLSLGMSLKEVLHDSNKKMGHAFVLAMLLQNKPMRQHYGSKR